MRSIAVNDPIPSRRRRAKTASTGVMHLVSSRQSELHFDEGDVQRRKFGGKELNREGGLDLYDQEARLYDPTIARFLRPDDLAEKYPSVSPYAFCLDNPLRNIDQNGDSVCVLIAPNTLANVGHMAILIQNDNNKWGLRSKNGDYESSPSFRRSGKQNDVDDNVVYDSPQAFLNSEKNQNSNNELYYTEGYIIPTTPQQDKVILNVVTEEIKKPYALFSSNCVQAVQAGLEAAGLKPGKARIRNNLDITFQSSYYYKSPNSIYKRIKQQNSGKVIKPY